jgi:hypothetical protein
LFACVNALLVESPVVLSVAGGRVNEPEGSTDLITLRELEGTSKHADGHYSRIGRFEDGPVQGKKVMLAKILTHVVCAALTRGNKLRGYA